MKAIHPAKRDAVSCRVPLGVARALARVDREVRHRAVLEVELPDQDSADVVGEPRPDPLHPVGHRARGRTDEYEVGVRGQMEGAVGRTGWRVEW